MEKLKLFEIEEEYIKYLQQFDKLVLNYSGDSYSKSRKYLGILLEINGLKYIAPLSSPNKKTDYEGVEIRKSIIPIIRIIKLGTKNVLLGTIKLSNMIPVHDEKVLKYYDVKKEEDTNYQKLILNELEFIYANKELIIKNSNKLYLQKINNMSMGYIKNTVDFKLLEEKSKNYKST